MVNSRRRTAASLCYCLAAAAAASAHGNGGTLPSVAVPSMHEAIVTSSPLKPPRRRRRQNTRRLGAWHQKGHSSNGAAEEGEELQYEQEETPMQFVMLDSSDTSVSTVAPDPDPEEPATDLTPYKQARIGGSSSFAARTDRYPYMASLQIEGSSPNSGKFDYHMCGGFLIAPDLVMTSAHCAEYTPPGTDDTFRAFNGIEVGHADLGKDTTYDSMNSHTYRLEYENLIPDKLIQHPHYDPTTYAHDLMIVKVFGRSRYGHVKVDRQDAAGGEEVTVIGWGATSADSNKKYSDELREADMLVMDNESCQNTQVEVTDPSTGNSMKTTLSENIFRDMMCATANNRYICYGDGGGPAIRRGNGPQEDTVTGIVSWGYGCVDPNYPAVMTRTAEHYQWIRTIVCKESTDPPEDYGCVGGMAFNSASATSKQTVTLKLKLDRMAIETGFVILSTPQESVVAQRVPGYYKIRENEIVEERMDLPSNQCYKLILLDSFGDGFCCDMGGGSGTLYLGTDTGYYTGRVLVEVNGKFEYDLSGDFCLDASSSVSGDSQAGSAVIKPSSGSSSLSSSSNGSGSAGSGSNNVSSGSYNGSTNNQSFGSNNGNGWSDPDTNPEFDYSTSDSQENGLSGGKGGGSGGGSSSSGEEEFDPEGDASNPDEYYVTVQFKFDDHPQDVSWVLYDLSASQVKMFVDFEVYTEEQFADQILDVVVSVAGPEEGEKQYAFTVYDKASDGLCCEHGKGYYKLFLGDVADDMQLLGDAKYEFSSSYYFTLFEEGNMTANGAEVNVEANSDESSEEVYYSLESSSSTEEGYAAVETDKPTAGPTSSPIAGPTASPTSLPTQSPTNTPSVSPTESPSLSPSVSPTTPKPTFPWETKRSEVLEEIGARWNTASITPPEGKFNDVGGDPRNFDFTAELHRKSGANTRKVWFRLFAFIVPCVVAIYS